MRRASPCRRIDDTRRVAACGPHGNTVGFRADRHPPGPLKTLEASLRIPDLWQQQAVGALRAGRDVVVHAPTGSGKTYVFELLYGSLKGQAVYTVPTRALANDKYAEWRAAGWDVGICTGDVSIHPGARVIVATLETQRAALLHGRGPRILVIDEYQMLGDSHRGANYELSLALAPPGTQLLLLSGSVGNPGDVAVWLRRLGRDVELVVHTERPVPLSESVLDALPYQLDARTYGYWPRLVAKALLADLGPILVFAPRRAAAEDLARDLAAVLPVDDPLVLSPEQSQLAGEKLAKLLRKRLAFHHSGLSYAARAGLIEPLAKTGQLRAVVATTGLAAGVNFSMRSVLVTDTRYTVRNFEKHLLPEELLQMFGRAGRRGLDESGFVLVAPGKPRLEDARPKTLRRSNQIDWPTLLGVMDAAAARGETPLAAAAELCTRLYSVQKIPLGVEGSVADGPRPCGLFVDAERARLAKPHSVEILNSRGEWEERTGEEVSVPLAELWVKTVNSPARSALPSSCRATAPVAAGEREEETNGTATVERGEGTNEQPTQSSTEASSPATGAVALQPASRDRPAPMPYSPALRDVNFMRGVGRGNLCKLWHDDTHSWIYGREIPLAVILNEHEVRFVKGMREGLEALGDEWRGRNFPAGGRLGRVVFNERIPPLIPALSGGGTPWRIFERGGVILAQADFSALTIRASLDSHGLALHDPPIRKNYPACCQTCPQLSICEAADPTMTPALAWRKLGLIEPDGTPTRRGILFSFFNHGEGLAVAAALEQSEKHYPVTDLIYDLANLRAGHRFTPEGDNPHAGRLGSVCARTYQRADHPGYLEMGVPPDYGDGAAQAVSELALNPGCRHRLLNDLLRPGDLERVLTEWRSLLLHVALAPDHPWDRWQALQATARKMVDTTDANALPTFPPLSAAQQRRYQHRLFLK